MCIISMMSGCHGYRETGRFLKRNQKEFQQSLRSLHKVPSYITVREVLQTVDFVRFAGVFNQWTGINRLIRVERYVSCKKQQRHETVCYISDIRSGKAALFAKHIRDHWGMENRLRQIKDVIMKDDESGIKTGMAVENISIIRNIVCNLFRSNGFHSIKYAIELHANNFKELFE